MKRIENLPNWCLVNKNPSFYDTESATVLEETSKIYGKIQELINDYNLLVDELNKKIDSFIELTDKDQECFKTEITKLIEDYIKSIDTTIAKQNLEIANAVEYMTTNLKTSITELITEMNNNGELDEAVLNAIDNIGVRVSTLENTEYTLVYEEGTENLMLQKNVKEGA